MYFFSALVRNPRVFVIRHSSADDHAVAAGAGGDGLVLLVADVALAVGAVVVVATSGAAAVELDTVALAGDAVSLAGAGAAVGAGGAVAGHGGAGRGAVGAVGQGRAGGGDGRGAEAGDDVVVLETGAAEAGGELLEGLVVVVVGVQDVLGGVGSHGLGGLDLGDGERAALGDVGRAVARGSVRVLGGVARGALGAGRLGAGRLGGRLGGGGRAGRGRLVGIGGNVEDVQLTAGGGLEGRADTGVVGDVVAVDDVVVPVSLTGLENGALELEGALP